MMSVLQMHKMWFTNMSKLPKVIKLAECRAGNQTEMFEGEAETCYCFH